MFDERALARLSRTRHDDDAQGAKSSGEQRGDGPGQDIHADILTIGVG
jgi:hypothetical protein